MEFDLIDLRLELEEILSCMVILQKAIDNENDKVLFSDISNCLEIISCKMKKIIKKFDVI